MNNEDDAKKSDRLMDAKIPLPYLVY